MRHVLVLLVLVALFGVVCRRSRADEDTSAPRPVPLTRPEMKQLLEDMKGRTPRIPLPELSPEEQRQTESDPRSFGYESRLRTLFLPHSDLRGYLFFGGSPRGGFGSGKSKFAIETDPAQSLDYRFKTMLFWIASRSNNCQYCLGHQESKLLAAGMVEEQIAALDCDWNAFTPAEQAAFALARRLTLEPHLLSDADIDACRPHYGDLQIIEMVMSVAGNNAINRWKEGVGVPQSQGGGNFGRRSEGGTNATVAAEEHSYLTPTAENYVTAASLVAPTYVDEANGRPSSRTICIRPDTESRTEVEEHLAAARARSPRLPLMDEEQARRNLGESAVAGPLPNWMRLLAHFPVAGSRTVASIRASEELGDLTPLLKAQISWIIARQDRAWYALGESQRRLESLGQTDDQIDDLDGSQAALSPADRALSTVARKLAAAPVVLTDDDVALAVTLAGPRDVVQVISYTTFRACFDRFTEAAGLQLEE